MKYSVALLVVGCICLAPQFSFANDCESGLITSEKDLVESREFKELLEKALANTSVETKPIAEPRLESSVNQLFAAEKYEEAEVKIIQYLRKYGGDIEKWGMYGQILLNLGKYRDIPSLKIPVPIERHIVNSLHDRAQKQFQSRLYSEALGPLLLLRIVKPKSVPVLGMYIQSLFKENRHSDIVSPARIALSLKPDDITLLGIYSEALFRLRNYEMAEPVLAKYLELPGGNRTRRRGMYANILFELGRFEESLEVNQRLFDLEPEKLTHYVGLFQNYARLGNSSEANRILDEIVQSADPKRENDELGDLILELKDKVAEHFFTDLSRSIKAVSTNLLYLLKNR